jgi:hypothetical protein
MSTETEIEIGSRVGAIVDCDEGSRTCKFLGYGTYEGQFRLGDEAVGGGAELIRVLYSDAENPHHEDIIMNPRIKLDNGERIMSRPIDLSTFLQI